MANFMLMQSCAAAVAIEAVRWSDLGFAVELYTVRPAELLNRTGKRYLERTPSACIHAVRRLKVVSYRSVRAECLTRVGGIHHGVLDISDTAFTWGSGR